MKNLIVQSLAILLLCSSKQLKAQDISIIPQPESMQVQKGSFSLASKASIQFTDPDIKSLATYAASALYDISGIQVPVNNNKAIPATINLIIVKSPATDPEGYALDVQPNKIKLTASTAQGLFYGVQTLLQLVPESGARNIPCVIIKDKPRFGWRGLMLDVSRHFFTVPEVKKMIDEMSTYKFNLLHLHLTDDQGWRIEIKSLPELTKIGAWRVPRTGLWWDRDSTKEGESATYGGFYTQDDIKDILKYAATKYIKVLPEIDVPGHSLAAIATYNNLSSTKLPYHVNPGSKFYTIEDNTLCPGQEATYEFLDKVFTEVAALFPFEYIHIGGDECYKGFWKKCAVCQQCKKDNNLKDENELQSYFIKRLEKMLHAKGKKLLGWDEILEGGLAPEATVMSWRGMNGGITAAKAKHHVVMSPSNYAYLDLYQGDPAIEPPTYSSLRLKDVYAFEPVPEGIDASYILGGQGNLWSESVPTWRHAEYMLWPRSFALSEVLWSPKSAKNWDNFISRTTVHMARMQKADINYAVSMFDAILQPVRDEKGKLQIKLDTEIQGLDLYYSFDDTYPDHHSPIYKKGVALNIPADAETFRVITYSKGKAIGRIITVPLADLEKRVKKAKT